MCTLRPLHPGWLLLLLAALASPAGAIVNTLSPVSGPSVAGQIPPLGVSGAIFDPPNTFTGPLFVQEGSYTALGDVKAPALTNLATWKTSFLAPLPTTATPALAAHLAEALDESDALLDEFDGWKYGEAFDLFAKIGSVNVPPSGTRRFLGYAPIRERWLRSQWGFAQSPPSQLSNEKKFTYAEPRPFREARLRGARLYCAAREAQFQQGASVPSMGERVGFSVKLLGKKIDFFVVEPSVVLDGPERFTGTGANDGAQAFEVPLLLGTRITPIRGLGLPSFGEIRVPVSLVAADSEVSTLAAKRNIKVGVGMQCKEISNYPWFVCSLFPGTVYDYSKEYQTVTHLDAIQTAEKTISASATIPLFRVGILAVNLDLGAQLGIGLLEPENRRLLSLPSPPFDIPPARAGRLWVSPWTSPWVGTRYHDGAWTLSTNDSTTLRWNVLPEGTSDPFWRAPLGGIFPPAHEIRALQNDDHALESLTSLAVDGALEGQLGGGWGPFEVSLSVTGGLSGTVVQRHLLRDALLAQDQGYASMTPITGLTLRPRQTANADLLPLLGKVRLYLDLAFTEIDIEKQIFKTKAIPLASYDSDDSLVAKDEEHVFRLGTGSATGNQMKKPVVRSHLPGGPEFASFPASVDACLADPTPNPPTPKPCDPVEDSGEPQSIEVCAYGPTADLRPIISILPANVCNSYPAFVAGLGLSPPQTECMEAYFGFLCAPVSKQQPFGGPPSVVARVLDFADPAQGAELASMLKTCVAAFVTPTGNPVVDKKNASDFTGTLLDYSLCRPSGILVPEDLIAQAVDPTTAPPVAAPPACH